jgi:AbrB family looped-hinge helix DNA binding protein
MRSAAERGHMPLWGAKRIAQNSLNCAFPTPLQTLPMHTASLSSKGQIVIPKAVRSELNLAAGTRFALSVEAGRLVLEPLREPEFDLDAIHVAVEALSGCLRQDTP